MNEPCPPKLAKWPFFLGDVLLLAVSAVIVCKQNLPLDFASTLEVIGCVALGAWLGVAPFLVEYRGQMKFAEANQLASTVGQIKNLQGVADQIAVATAQWQIIQEHSEKSTSAAKEIGERMATEAKAFAEFMQKANDTEKAHLRVETDKLRRNEGEWLQLVVRLLDHGYALHQAGVRFGQPAIAEQLGRFQNACRDLVRRVGLAPFAANPDDLFDSERHQLIDPDGTVPAGARVAETVATGFNFQGQTIRRALVTLKKEDPAPVPAEVSVGREAGLAPQENESAEQS